MKTTTKILTLVSFLSLSFAGIAHAGEGAARRGQVNVQAAAAKAVVAGPAVVKMYSGFSGAQVFVAAASSGTDADCAAARTETTKLPADHVESARSSCCGTRSRALRLPRSSRSDNNNTFALVD